MCNYSEEYTDSAAVALSQSHLPITRKDDGLCFNQQKASKHYDSPQDDFACLDFADHSECTIRGKRVSHVSGEL